MSKPTKTAIVPLDTKVSGAELYAKIEYERDADLDVRVARINAVLNNLVQGATWWGPANVISPAEEVEKRK